MQMALPKYQIQMYTNALAKKWVVATLQWRSPSANTSLSLSESIWVRKKMQ